MKVKRYVLTGDRIAVTEAVATAIAMFAVRTGELMGGRGLRYTARGVPPHAVQASKAVLNQVLRANAVTALGYGLVADYQSDNAPEYPTVPDHSRVGGSVAVKESTSRDEPS